MQPRVPSCSLEYLRLPWFVSAVICHNPGTGLVSNMAFIYVRFPEIFGGDSKIETGCNIPLVLVTPSPHQKSTAAWNTPYSIAHTIRNTTVPKGSILLGYIFPKVPLSWLYPTALHPHFQSLRTINSQRAQCLLGTERLCCSPAMTLFDLHFRF